jgi:hypothetical protein
MLALLRTACLETTPPRFCITPLNPFMLALLLDTIKPFSRYSNALLFFDDEGTKKD